MKKNTSMLFAAAMTLPGFAISETEFLNIPPEYRQVEFVQSSGTQYIDTGIVPGSTTQWTTDFQVLSFPPFDDHGELGAAYCGWYGETEDDESFRFGIGANYVDDDGTFWFVACVNDKDLPVHAKGVADYSPHTIVLSGNSILLDGTKIGDGSIGNTATDGQTLYLFAVHDESSDGADYFIGMKLFSSKILRGAETVRDFVPCIRTNDNAVGLYDRVSGEFFGNGGSGSFVAGDFVSHSAPIATFNTATASNIVATFTGTLEYLGDDSESHVLFGGCDLFVSYAPEGEPMCDPVRIGTDLVLGAFTNTLSGLFENTSYRYSVFASNAVAASEIATGTFYTKTEMTPVSTPVYYRGLQQAKFPGASSWTTNFTESIIPLEIVPGPIGADLYCSGGNKAATTPATNPYTGHQFFWSDSYSTFAYRGEIHLTARQTITFGKYLDDSAYIVVTETNGNRRVVLNHENWNSFGVASFTAPVTGWYPIDIRAGDGTDAKGPYAKGPWGTAMGLGYNLIGLQTSEPAQAWKILRDPGDMSFFRYVETNESFMAFTSPRAVGSTVYSAFEFQGVPSFAKLRAYYGAVDCGETTSGWDGYVDVADIGPGDTIVKSYAFPGLADHYYCRFCLIAEADNQIGFQQFSPVFQFDQPGASIGLSSDASEYPDTIVELTVTDFGLGASSITNLVLEISEKEDFSEIATNCVIATPIVDKGGIRTVLHLMSERIYFARVLSVNDQAVAATSGVLSFRSSCATPATATISPIHTGPNYTVLKWSVADFGAPFSDSLRFSIDWSRSRDFENFTSGLIHDDVAGDLPVSGTALIKGLPSSAVLFFRIHTINSAGTSAFSESISIETPVGATDRIWANEGDGNMLAGESYLEGVPPTSTDVIYFTDPPVVQPYLSTNLTVKGLFFGPLNNDTLPDLDGYVMTGAEGMELTLNAAASDWALDSRATGTIRIDVPICLTANNVNFGGSCADIVVSKPIRTSGVYTQDVNTQTDGTDAKHCGSLTLSAAGPEFKPKQIHCSFATDLRIAHPEAIIAVTNIVCGHWGGTQYPRMWNLCDGPIVLDNLRGFTGESHGLNEFTFNGNPFIMTNCDYAVSPRESKLRKANAAVTVRRIWISLNNDHKGASFACSGTNMWETLEDYVEPAGQTNHILVQDGMFYPHHLEGGAIRPDRRFRLNGDGGGYPTVGIDQDAHLFVENLGGISFGKDNEQKSGGFSGMGGDIHVTLVDEQDNAYVLTNGTKTPSGVGYATPSPWVFGNVSATGTAILDNDVNFSGAQELWAFQGLADVAGRFAGDVETRSLSATGNYGFTKKGNGAIAFDKSLNVKSTCTIEAGGVFVNCTVTNVNWTVKNSGYIGGTGFVANLDVREGGAIRAGESTLGELRASHVTMNTGSKLLVDVARDGVGCLRLVDPSKDLSGTGPIYVVPKFYGTTIQGRVKIVDWSEVQEASVKSLLDPSIFQVDYDPEVVVAAGLSSDAEGLYLSYRLRRDIKKTTMMLLQ